MNSVLLEQLVWTEGSGTGPGSSMQLWAMESNDLQRSHMAGWVIAVVEKVCEPL